MTPAFADSAFVDSAFIDPTQPRLNIPASVLQDAWQQSQSISMPGGRWQAYLNQISQQVILDWVLDECSQQLSRSPSVFSWPSSAFSPVCWELVNGSVMTFGDFRLAIIPMEGVGYDELEVPQEWVDISGVAADYYLALQVNPQESWIDCWGYITHQRLSEVGHFDATDRTYRVDANLLTRDVSTLWPTIEFCPNVVTQAEIAPLPSISVAQRTNLVERLAKQDVAFPRLSVPFAQWSALFADEQTWQQLCTQRLASYQGEESSQITRSAGDWLQALQADIRERLQRWQPLNQSFNAGLADAGLATVAARSVPDENDLAEDSLDVQQLLSQRQEIQLGEVTVLLAIRCVVDDEGLIDTQFQLSVVDEAQPLPDGLVFALIAEGGEFRETVQVGQQVGQQVSQQASQMEGTVLLSRELKFAIGDRFTLVVSLGDNDYMEIFEA
ncbi:MAG: DUF1822 family protein [Cyanobacteria bacterium J06621_11]